eukprot:6059741-Amphidinium_carterae.1
MVIFCSKVGIGSYEHGDCLMQVTLKFRLRYEQHRAISDSSTKVRLSIALRVLGNLTLSRATVSERIVNHISDCIATDTRVPL